MRYRKIINGDVVFGHGQNDFWQDVPEAPAQAVMTRLQLREGEWFLDTTAGTPWNTEVLGKYTADTRDTTIRQRVLGTQGVTDLVSYSSSFNPETRAWAAALTINTQYGQTTITTPL